MPTGWTGGCPSAGFGYLTPAAFVALVPHGGFAQQDRHVAQDNEVKPFLCRPPPRPAILSHL